MEDTNNKKQRVVFPTNTFQIVSEILQKYNLQETDDEILKKIEKNESFNGEIITGVVEKVVLGEMPKKEMPVLLQKELNIPKDSAQNLSLDIENRLLLSTEKVDEEEEEIEEIKEKISEEKKQIEDIFPKIKPTTEEKLETATVASPKIGILKETVATTPIKKEEKIIKTKKLITKKPTSQKEQTKGPDPYREPIE